MEPIRRDSESDDLLPFLLDLDLAGSTSSLPPANMSPPHVPYEGGGQNNNNLTDEAQANQVRPAPPPLPQRRPLRPPPPIPQQQAQAPAPQPPAPRWRTHGRTADKGDHKPYAYRERLQDAEGNGKVRRRAGAGFRHKEGERQTRLGQTNYEADVGAVRGEAGLTGASASVTSVSGSGRLKPDARIPDRRWIPRVMRNRRVPLGGELAGPSVGGVVGNSDGKIGLQGNASLGSATGIIGGDHHQLRLGISAGETFGLVHNRERLEDGRMRTGQDVSIPGPGFSISVGYRTTGIENGMNRARQNPRIDNALNTAEEGIGNVRERIEGPANQAVNGVGRVVNRTVRRAADSRAGQAMHDAGARANHGLNSVARRAVGGGHRLLDRLRHPNEAPAQPPAQAPDAAAPRPWVPQRPVPRPPQQQQQPAQPPAAEAAAPRPWVPQKPLPRPPQRRPLPPLPPRPLVQRDDDATTESTE